MTYQQYKKIREEKGFWNDNVFAKTFGIKFGFTQQSINKWANGKEATLELQLKIAKALKLPQNIIFEK